MSKHTNPFKGRRHIKGIVGVIAAMFAVTAGIGSIALAQNATNDPAQNAAPAVSRTFQAEGDGAAQAAAAKPSVTLALYKADDQGDLTLDGKQQPVAITGSATMSPAARAAVTLHDEAFLSDEDKAQTDATKVFDKDSGKYVGTKKADAAFVLTVGSTAADGVTASKELTFTYGDFVQVKDKDGKVVANSYEVKPADGQLIDFAASGTKYTFKATKYANADFDAAAVDFKTGLGTDGNGDSLTYDTDKPVAATGVALNGWTVGTADGQTTALSDGNASFAITFATAPATGDTVTITKGTEQVAELANPTTDPANGSVTYTWNPVDLGDGVFNAADYAVTTAKANDPENTNAVMLRALIADALNKDVPHFAIDKDNLAKPYTLTPVDASDKPIAGTDGYYAKVAGFTITQPDADKTLFGIRAQLTKPLATLTRPDTTAGAAPGATTTVDVPLKSFNSQTGTAVLDIDSSLTNGVLADGAYTIASKLPGQTDGPTGFTVDSTAPVIGKVTYVTDADYDDIADGTIVAVGADENSISRSFTLTVTEAGAALDADHIADHIKVSGLPDGVTVTPSIAPAKDDAGADKPGEYVVTLPFNQPGTYDLAKITVTVTDKVGNGSAEHALDESGYQTLTLIDPNPQRPFTSSLDVVAAAGDKTADVNGTTWHSKVPAVNVKTANPFAARILGMAQRTHGADVVFTSTLGGKTTNITYNDLAVSADGRTIALKTGQPAKDGTYTFAVARNRPLFFRTLFQNFNPDTQTFGVDTAAPQITKVSFTPAGDFQKLSGSAVLVNGKTDAQKVAIAVTDAGSGVADKGVALKVRFTPINADGTKGKTVDKEIVAAFDEGSNAYQAVLGEGRGTDDQGIYDFSAATVTTKDNLGNVSDAFSVPGQNVSGQTPVFPYTTVVVDKADDKVSKVNASLTVAPGEGSVSRLDGITLNSQSPMLRVVLELLAQGSDKATVADGTSETGAKYTLYAAAKDVTFDKETNALAVPLDITEFNKLGDAQKNGNHAITLGANFSGSDAAFLFDNTAPTFTGAAYKAGRGALADSALSPINVTSETPATITLDARDFLPDATTDSANGKVQTSGVDRVEARVTYIGNDKKEHTDEWKSLARVDQNDPNKVVLTLGEVEGKYDIDKVQLRVIDGTKAEANVSKEITFAQLKADFLKSDDKDIAAAAKAIPNTIVVSEAKPKGIVHINDVDPQPSYNADISGISIAVSDDPWFDYKWNEVISVGHRSEPLLTGNVSYADKSDELRFTISDATYKDGVITLDMAQIPVRSEQDPNATGRQFNGDYTLTLIKSVGGVTLFNDQSTGAVMYKLDTKHPQLTKLATPDGAAGVSVTDVDVAGKTTKVYAASTVTNIDVWVKDLLPNGQGDPKAFNDDGIKNENGTSGINDDTVIAHIPAATDLDGKVLIDAYDTLVKLDDKGHGTIAIGDPNKDGLYDLSVISVEAFDRAGSAGNKLNPISVFDGSVTRVGALKYTAIIADTKADNGVTVRVEKADGSVPDSSDGNNYYFRGKVKATYTITDKWFPVYRTLNDGKQPGLLGGSWANVDPLHGNEQHPITGLAASNGGWARADGYTWTLANQTVRIAGQGAQLEGQYHLNIVYHGLRPESVNASKDFVMDWTAPQLGDLTSNQRGPVRWNWLFSPGSFTATLNGISDNVSGVVTDSARLSSRHFDNWLSGKGDPEPVYAGDNKGGSVSITMDSDSQRMFLDGTSIALTDVAGNPVDTGAFSRYEGVNGHPAGNMLKGLAGVAIDTVAPTLSITYDNNDVRNGKYYKAYRTGTVTLVESNFDFSKANEDGRVIVRDVVDGEVRTLPVSAFSNPSGDRRTYVASFPANLDGDWVIDAAYSDPADHASNNIHEEYTIDTIVPQLTLTFDNTDVRNGMYYNADRTATVRQVERNFSDAESVVTTTAADDNGSSAPAPSGSGWAYTGGDREASTHTSTVLFSGEYHYTLRATAVDLAGNVATEVSEPEFVIDKTKPTVKIDRVEDKTAYAGEVAPLIDYDDTNIDKSTVTYTLEGAHRGELKDADMPANTGTDTDNTRTVDFADFERKPEVDDVYTLKAKATDLAGNEIETEKTFSANRFGSTYTFNAGTQNLRGAYIKKSQDVRVTEINVSGLDAGKSQVVVAKNDKATTLARDSYTVKAGDDKGWSSTIYTIPASNFADDGYYRVQLQSVDNAGNLSQNTMENKDADRKSAAEVNFALDTTAPTSSLLNVQSGSVYYDQAGLDMSVNTKDNLGIAKSEVYLDGIIAKSWTGEELLSSTPDYVIAADDSAHRIVVRTVDLAGNESTATYDNVYVASSWWQYATHTPWILNTMIFGGLILAALLVALIVMLIQRRKRNAYRRNPFGV